MARSNKEIVAEINVPSKPSMGASIPASKDNRGNAETQTAKHVEQTVFDAKEVPNAARKAIDAQCGHPETGPDNFPLANSGCGNNAGDCKKK